MTSLNEMYHETKARGRFGRIPHVSVWYDEERGWRATCAGVFCNTETVHGSPEAAVRSAFENAERMAERYVNQNQHNKKELTDDV